MPVSFDLSAWNIQRSYMQLQNDRQTIMKATKLMQQKHIPEAYLSHSMPWVSSKSAS